MSLYALKNNEISIAVESLGAELKLSLIHI